MSKSPFFVVQDFISPEEASTLAQLVKVESLRDQHGTEQASERYHAEAESKIFQKLKELTPQLEAHFPRFTYAGTEKMVFQQFPATNARLSEDPHCESAILKRKKWLRINDRALTGVLWLKDYQDSPPFNVDTQVLGGKLEFPVYNFGFQPQRGTLVIYPACERFISQTSTVLVGTLQTVRINICPKGGFWLYDPREFPGDFRTWFSHVV